jgi:Na+(H+)/acetate symporter ActP
MSGGIWLNRLIMAASFIVLIWLGWRSSLVFHANNDDGSGFLLAGRSLGPFVGAATIVAPSLSGRGFMGSPGVAYQYGLIKLPANFMFASAMLLAVLFFAKYLSKRAKSMGRCTIPEYVARQCLWRTGGYGVRIRHLREPVAVYRISMGCGPANRVPGFNRKLCRRLSTDGRYFSTTCRGPVK